MALTLRPYQDEIISELRAHMKKGQRRLLICSPTGSGKTALTAKMLGTSASKNMRAVFIVHRRELIKQSALAFHKAGVYHGIIANGFPEDSRALIQIASVQTLSRRLHKLRPPEFIVWDECHHIAAGSWSKVFEAFPNAFHVGLTATPIRLDGKGLDKWFDVMIKGPNVSWLIDNEFLSPYRLYASQKLSLEGVRSRMGDYRREEIAEAVDKPRITGCAVEEYKRRAPKSRAVVFCVSVEHSHHVVSEFNRAGIKAIHVDGETHSIMRDRAIEKFASGEIQVLSNVDLFGEGFDLPAMECAILLRPTQSTSLYLQQVGRVLRPSPGKSEAIILDHVNNYERHGLPDDLREWTLNGFGPKNSGKQSGLGVKICEQCFAAMHITSPKCNYCGFLFPKKDRTIEQVDGELSEIDTNILKAKRAKEQKRAKTLEELTELGIQRGYKRPRLWAKHVFMARRKREIGGA